MLAEITIRFSAAPAAGALLVVSLSVTGLLLVLGLTAAVRRSMRRAMVLLGTGAAGGLGLAAVLLRGGGAGGWLGLLVFQLLAAAIILYGPLGRSLRP